VLANRDPAGIYHYPLEPLGFNFEWRAIGIDQRAGELHVTVKTLMPDGRHRLDFFCIVEESGKAASDKAVHLALAWGCKIAIVDGEPSYHLFVDIANGLKDTPCLVYQQDYVDGVGTSIVRYEDKRSDKSTKKNTGAPKYPKRALVSRYHAIDWSLNLFTLVRNILPVDIYAVNQMRNIGGTMQNTELGKHWVEHMRNIARVKMPTYKTDQATGEKFEVVGELIGGGGGVDDEAVYE
jgi:hypothetical protein